jgi:hypothetical protein
MQLFFYIAFYMNSKFENCWFENVKNSRLRRMFIKATMPRDKGNQNSALFLRQTQEAFGCLQLWVFNPKPRLSTAVKCDPEFRVCVNDPPSIHIPDN